MARRYSGAAVAIGHNALTRAIRHAEACDLVGRNVAMLVDTPKGQAGRPSKSLSLQQASALLAAAEGTRMHAYTALCLATGIRTEEARVLRWEHVDFGNPDGEPPVPASAAVWRSVRLTGIPRRKSRARRSAPLRSRSMRCWPIKGSLQGRRDRRALDATRAASLICIADIQYGVPVEEIARIAGHSNSRTTEVVYRRELRPILTTGAEAMDKLFNPRAS